MTNLKQIIANTPLNTVFLSAWLERQGIKPKSIFDHRKYGWLKSIGRGAFIKSGATKDIFAGISAIQYQTTYDLHLGGKFALDNYHNIRHYLQNNQLPELFTVERKALPRWFSNAFPYHYQFIRTTFLPKNTGVDEIKTADIKLKISSLERALLEMLYLVPERISTKEAYQIFEMITVVKVDLLNTLLSSCQSVKVKRLFMYFSSLVNYPWFHKLADVNLGSGTRIIDPTGKYNKKYNIIINSLKED